MTVDRNKLIKLLNMTESAHDGESLNAIRASNALLRQSKTTWAELICAATSPQPGFEPPASPRRADPKTDAEYEQETSDRPANWGHDLFGDRPSLHASPAPAKERADERARRKDALRTYIAAVPIWLRIAFFPAWAFAFAYAAAVHAEPRPKQIFAMIVPLTVGVLTGLLWLLIIGAAARAFG